MYALLLSRATAAHSAIRVAAVAALALALGISAGSGQAQQPGDQAADAATDRQFGELLRFGENEITIRTDKGEEKNFTMSQDAKVLLDDRPVGLKDLKAGDDVSVIFKKDNPGTAMSLLASREAAEQVATTEREARRPVESDRPAALGVVIQETSEGVEVLDVQPGSAADKAGLREGDLIRSINDQKIDSPAKLSDLIRQQKPGDKVKIKVFRDDGEKDFDATLASRGDTFRPDPRVDRRSLRRPGRFGEGDGMRPPQGPWLGLFLDESDDEEQAGVRVLRVFPNGPADKAGLKRGDVILGIDDADIGAPRDVLDALEDLQPGDKAELTLRGDDDQERKVQVEVGDRAQMFRDLPRMREGMRFGPGADDGRFGPGPDAMMDQTDEDDQQRDRIEDLGQQVLDELKGLRQELNELRDRIDKQAPPSK